MWVGRATLNGENNGDGLSGIEKKDTTHRAKITPAQREAPPLEQCIQVAAQCILVVGLVGTMPYGRKSCKAETFSLFIMVVLG